MPKLIYSEQIYLLSADKKHTLRDTSHDTSQATLLFCASILKILKNTK